MAITFAPIIKKTEQKKDGTWNVKIRVTTNSKVGYIPTDYHVMKHQLSRRGMEIIDVDVLTSCEEIIKRYNKYILTTPQSSIMEIKELMAFLKESYIAEMRASSGINLFDIAEKYITSLINENRDGYASTIHKTLSLLKTYYGTALSIDAITLNWLNGFQVSQIKRGLKQASVNLHLRNIRTLFNYAINTLNDEDNGIIVIRHYPFRKFKFRAAPAPAKRNTTIDVIKKIAEFPSTGNRRVDMARDVFILSLCLCGMNTADLYSCTDYHKGRISYIRQKSKRKGEKAFISVAIPDIIFHIAEKYRDKNGSHVFDFYSRYTSSESFYRNVNKGLAYICSELGIEPKITSYYARHTFATIARVNCGVNIDDIAVCLTHSSGHDVTDRYIAEDWSIVDRTQTKVIKTIFGENLTIC